MQLTLKFAEDFYHRGIFAKRIFQQLFNLYKNKGGDLSNLSELMCDYDTIKKMLVEKPEWKIYWSFDKYGVTEITDYYNGNSYDGNYLIEFRNYICTITEVE